MDDKLAKDLRLLAAANARQQALLELLALQREPIGLDLLSLLLSLSGLEGSNRYVPVADLYLELLPLQKLLRLSQHAAGIAHSDIRRHLLQQFQDSPRAAGWLARLPTLITALAAHSYYRRRDAVRALVRAFLLAGASRSEIETALGAEHLDDFDWSMAVYGLVPAPIDTSRVLRLHASVAMAIVAQQVQARINHPSADLRDFLDLALQLIRGGADNDDLLQPIVGAAWMCGHDELLAAIPAQALAARRGADLLQLAFASNSPQAVIEFAQAPTPKGARRATTFDWPGLPGLLLRLALLVSDADDSRAWALRMLGRLRKSGDIDMADGWLRDCCEDQRIGRPIRLMSTLGIQALPPLSLLMARLLARWYALTPSPEDLPVYLHGEAALRQAGYTRMLAAVEAASDPAISQGPPLWRQVRKPWQELLGALGELAKSGGDERAPTTLKYSRIRVQLLDISPGGGTLRLMILEQKATPAGWSKGRQLSTIGQAVAALERLAPDNDGDRLLLRALAAPNGNWYPTLLFAHSPAAALLPRCSELVDIDERPLRAELVKPVLALDRRDDGSVLLKLTPRPPSDSSTLVQQVDDCLQIYRFNTEHTKIARLIDAGGVLPAATLPELLALAPALSHSLQIQAAIGSATASIAADSRIHVLIDPLRDGLRMRLRVRPLGDQGVHLIPGVGQTELLGLQEGLPVRARRDLPAERAALGELLEQIPLLAGGETGDPVDLAEPEAALETLSQLTERGDAVPLIWPAGRRLSMSGTRSTAHLQMKVRAQRDWFHADGGLALEDGNVVSLATLLEALPSSQGRFLRLSGDRIIALSADLTRKLYSLRALADERGRIELAPVAAGMLQPLLDSEAEVDLDRAFKAQLARMERASRSEPVLPRDFQAELRDYQLEGFRWLMRLADWGAGACLADDMGLGKTIQALAVLLARAAAGPALVVAPTSVVGNWRNEANRFAPTLEVTIYGEGNRELALESLAPGSVLLISYGLLTLNIERLASLRFATLVLDEAQAVKNAQAQRTQAIRQLNADARIATTGTPIENHLGELWSLMRILNPGLLGSQERFAKRFVTPLERDPRAPERDVLRRLIAPFLLRRMKSQVLDELPPRTEIVLSIEPSAGEAALLAAVRKQSIERLALGGVPEETKRFHVLAELTRLRRAACHPSLVAPELKLGSAKFDQLLELVRELKDNRHRALVFSQFTDYLALVRQAFDAEGISYLYLDGSTAARARDSAVADFQRGVGDVFLLSLKAGGVGLNLTAADYVIHLDPWWNPAVEQQATDRAHRIGQNRPVTVYKLIVKGSIEEQILALHGSKRELVDSMLGDQDVPRAFSVDELLSLLQPT